nr:uncharacterized protein LOC107281594 [Oryza sativa Japonica Group]
MRGMDKMHSDDGKLMRIIALKDEIARLKKENAQLKGLPIPGGVRIRNMPRKSTTAPVRIQLAPRNPPPPAAPAAPPVLPAVPAARAALAPVPAPAPVSAPASALSFAPASAVRGPASGNGGWLPATPSGSRNHISSSSSGSELGQIPGAAQRDLAMSRRTPSTPPTAGAIPSIRLVFP